MPHRRCSKVACLCLALLFFTLAVEYPNLEQAEIDAIIENYREEALKTVQTTPNSPNPAEL